MTYMRNRNRKIFAGIFLVIFSIQTFYPGAAYALTSGPSQPEMEKFEPAGTANMVDLFTGDFKYNIPLMDVGGYPVNLSYQVGSTGMEDEASWVGAGWTLNAGAVTRTLRGLPDDFKGDNIKKYYDRKEKVKVGAEVTLKPTILGWEFGSPSFKVNVYKDNYYGVGASSGVSASWGYSIFSNRRSYLTAGLDINLTSDTRDGVGLEPTMGMDMAFAGYREANGGGLSGGFMYNTRQGLKASTLQASFGSTRQVLNQPVNMKMSATHLYGESYTPIIPVNTNSTDLSLSMDFGPSIFGAYIGVGGKGYYYKENIESNNTDNPAYGYLYHKAGRENINTVQDFNREKDGTFLETVPVLGIPVATNDYFMATGQGGSSQFRVHLPTPFNAFDKLQTLGNTKVSVGTTLGAGNLFKAGGRIEVTDGTTLTRKWRAGNYMLEAAGEKAVAPNVEQPEEMDQLPYMKQVGERTQMDYNYFGKAFYNHTVKAYIGKGGSRNEFLGRDTTGGVNDIKKQPGIDNREKRTESITYLTAKEALRYGLDKDILSYSSPLAVPQKHKRIVLDDLDKLYDDPVRKAHHISEIQVTDKGGKRSVYGIPVYNTRQVESSFSCNSEIRDAAKREKQERTGLVPYTTDNTGAQRPIHSYGRDKLLSQEHIPDYPTSFLLTGELSPDYVDVTGNGISDDDRGTAYKFKYTRTSNAYKWRTPFSRDQMVANFNENMLSDYKDDKASIVYGQRELWYMNCIESKTMIAVFEISDRNDGMGVEGQHTPGVDVFNPLKKLDKIKLYSKAAYIADPVNAVPIKTVHFDYGYTLFPGMPNSNGGGAFRGKLTLNKVYFTFGSNSRGITNPYEFTYDTRNIYDGSLPGLPAIPDAEEASDVYVSRGTDRWGTYKKSYLNRVVNGNRALNNSQFPYTPQENENTPWDEGDLQNRLVSKWQLIKVVTPAGSIISVDYEADDYAYVQNKRAMQMCFVKGIESDGNNIGLMHSSKLLVEIPEKVSKADFLNAYLGDANNIFYKMYVDVDNRGHFEYINGYAEIDRSRTEMLNDNTAVIYLKMMDGEKNYNPITKAAWQLLRSNLPQYAYDGYDNSEIGNPEVAIRAIIQSLVNLRELWQPFESKAEGRRFANRIDWTKSMVRLYSPKGKKIGGGARVKKITISDDWQAMQPGVANTKTSVYGQEFTYETVDNNKNVISSGVASYEPSIGNEENPFHEPVNYTEKVYWSSDRNHFIEKPYCESWYPGPQVGYSKVKVTDFGADGQAETGYIEHEFYTAKDFPTLVDNTTLDSKSSENSFIIRLFAAIAVKRMVASQGFKVELNDMHGKAKAVNTFNKKGSKIASVEYFYHVKDENAVIKELNNVVTVLGADGDVKKNVHIATDIDVITDNRESGSEDLGVSIAPYAGSLLGLVLPIGYGAFHLTPSKSVSSFRAVSVVKVINRYGLIKKIKTMQNGSVTEAENLMWDGESGEPLLVKNQNEFDFNSYSFTYPAWMVTAYRDGMGGAYKNVGTVFENFSTDQNGVVADPQSLYKPYLFAGDELGKVVESGNGLKGWIIKSGNETRLIDKEGNFIQTSGKFMVLRSGRRNMLGASAGTVVTLSNPIAGGVLKLEVERRILDSKAVEYSEEWSTPIPNKYLNNLDNPCGIETSCMQDLIYGLIATSVGSRGKAITAWSDIAASLAMSTESPCYSNLYAGKPASQLQYSTEVPHPVFGFGYILLDGDIAHLGDATIRYDMVHPDLNDWFLSPYTYGVIMDQLNASYYNNSNTQSYKKYWFIKESNCQYVLRRIDGVTFNEPPYPETRLAVEPNPPVVTGYTDILRFTFTPGIVKTCQEPIDKVMNPYVEGVLGNWRTKTANIFATNRVQRQSQSTVAGSTDIRNAGHYASYQPFWTFNNGGITKSAGENWIMSDYSVYYDTKGNEIESAGPISSYDEKGAPVTLSVPLVYKTALYGYQNSLAVAVAGNARHNEVMYDGFEDYRFNLQPDFTEPCPPVKHFDWQLVLNNGNWCSSAGCLVTSKAHTGRYSYQINTPVTITRGSGLAEPAFIKGNKNVYGFDAQNHYVLKLNELAAGFAPVASKKYLLSMWVYDNSPANDKIQNLGMTINGQTIPVSTTVVPVAEGWKKLDVVFTAGTSLFTLNMNPSGTIFIDDIRIQPFDSHLSSYVYDDRTLRLTAQLDDNNYATVFEYDEEGTPVRVKKETEKGMMTLKENRQFLRKRK